MYLFLEAKVCSLLTLLQCWSQYSGCDCLSLNHRLLHLCILLVSEVGLANPPFLFYSQVQGEQTSDCENVFSRVSRCGLFRSIGVSHIRIRIWYAEFLASPGEVLVAMGVRV